MVCFNNYRLTLGLLGALLVGGGVIMSEHSVDMQRGAGGVVPGGIFLAGWLLIAYTVSLDNKNKFSGQRFLRIGIPALLVFGAAAYAQSNLQDRRKAMVAAGVFMAAWLFFAWQIATDGKFTARNLDKKRAWWSFAGAIGVGASMAILFMNRRYNVIANDYSGPSNIYNPGLPLFTVAWIALVGSIAL